MDIGILQEMETVTLISTLLPYMTFIIVISIVVWNIILTWRLRRLTKGTNGANLEQHLAHIARDYQDLETFKQTVLSRIENIDTRVQGSIRGIGVVRFNPFAGSGMSKPSFAAAFLNENGTGLVISTLHARNSLSIFTKSISNFKSENELTEEESGALEKAKSSLHT